jgi:malate/lactate dehydrogenase
MVSRALSLLEELINLEIEIDEIELSDEEKEKLKTLLNKLRESIYSEVFNSKG